MHLKISSFLNEKFFNLLNRLSITQNSRQTTKKTKKIQFPIELLIEPSTHPINILQLKNSFHKTIFYRIQTFRLIVLRRKSTAKTARKIQITAIAINFKYTCIDRQLNDIPPNLLCLIFYCKTDYRDICCERKALYIEQIQFYY